MFSRQIKFGKDFATASHLIGALREPFGYVDGVNRYQFVGGDPVGLVDPSGLKAWNHTKNWTQKERDAYREYVGKNAEKYVAQEKGINNCGQLPFVMLVDFAEQNGLPVTFDSPNGEISSFDPAFNGRKEFFDKVLPLVSPDTLANLKYDGKGFVENALKNTTPRLREDEVLPGDILNKASYGKGVRGPHSAIVTSVMKDGKPSAGQVPDGRGGFKAAPSVKSYNGSDSRTEDRYISGEAVVSGGRFDTCDWGNGIGMLYNLPMHGHVNGWGFRIRTWHENVFKPDPGLEKK